MDIDQPTDIRQGEALDLEKLNSFLSTQKSIGTVVSQKQFPGGYSNLTYLVETAQAEFILRRPPFGAAIKSAHDMGREFKVLSLLRSHYSKVPQPILYVEDLDVMGAPFYIMQRIRGLILRPSIIKEIKLDSTQMRALSESLVDNLVDLHRVDIQGSGLFQLSKSSQTPTEHAGYVTRQVDGWTKRYAAAQTDVIPTMDELANWLQKNQPADGPHCLIHNDYKYDNIIFNPDRLPEILGVLDWEMATIGDPWMDLGASLAYWAEPGEGDLARVFNVSWLPGNLTRKEVVERYTELSGRSVDSPVFYYVFGLFKNAVIAQQIYARWKLGHSKDPRFGQLIHVIKDLGRRGMASVSSNTL